MKNYDWILFDLDGTLIKSERGILRCMRTILAEFGYDADGQDLSRFIGPPLQNTFKALLGEALAREAVPKYRALYGSGGYKECEMYDGVPEMLAALHGHYRLAIASAKVQSAVDKILGHLGISRYFELTVGSLPDGSRSDKHESIGCLLEMTNAAPDRVLMIGDRDFDLIGARKTGVDALGVLYGYGSREELEAQPSVYLAATPGEVANYLLQGNSGQGMVSGGPL